MPLDYHAAPSALPGPVGPVDRGTVIAAVERYLASRGIAVAASGSGPSCSCEPAAKPVAQSVVPNVAAEVVDRFLARRADSPPKGGFG